MRITLSIVFWSLATLEGAWLLFVLFVSLAAGLRMAWNGDVATPLICNVLLPLAALGGAILLLAKTRSPMTRGIALLIVMAPVLWVFTWAEGETIYTTFENSSADNSR